MTVKLTKDNPPPPPNRFLAPGGFHPVPPAIIGYPILAALPCLSGGEPTPGELIVVAWRPDHDPHPFVVWRIVRGEITGRWEAVHGDYLETYPEALEVLTERSGFNYEANRR